MRTAFEFTHGALGAQNAILGGGRYDGLSEALGGPHAPGIGFAIGEDRLVMSLPQSAESALPKPDVYIAPLGAGMNRPAARLARELRRQDLVTELGRRVLPPQRSRLRPPANPARAMCSSLAKTRSHRTPTPSRTLRPANRLQSRAANLAATIQRK